MKFTWLKQLFTEANNEVLSLHKVGWGVVTGLWASLGGYAVVIAHQAFAWDTAAIGGAALVSSLGAANLMSKGAETPPGDKP